MAPALTLSVHTLDKWMMKKAIKALITVPKIQLALLLELTIKSILSTASAL